MVWESLIQSVTPLRMVPTPKVTISELSPILMMKKLFTNPTTTPTPSAANKAHPIETPRLTFSTAISILEKTRTLAAERSYKSVARVITSDSVKTTRTACDPSTAETFDQVRKRPGATALKTSSRTMNAPINPYFSTCLLSLPKEWLLCAIARRAVSYFSTSSTDLSQVTTLSDRVFCQLRSD